MEEFLDSEDALLLRRQPSWFSLGCRLQQVLSANLNITTSLPENISFKFLQRRLYQALLNQSTNAAAVVGIQKRISHWIDDQVEIPGEAAQILKSNLRILTFFQVCVSGFFGLEVHL